MKYLFFIITLCYPVIIQGQFIEGFNDLELSNNPSWFGDTSHFTIEDGILNLNADSAGRSQLYTSFTLSGINEFKWSFDLRLDFSPSDNNKLLIDLYMIDPVENEQSIQDRVYIQIGENGANDAIELYHYSSGLEEALLILRGVDGNVSAPFEKYFEILYQNGYWKLYSRDNTTPYLEMEEEANYSIDFLDLGFFKLDLYYTNSNVDGFHFDTISVGEYHEDTTAATMDSLQVVNENEVTLFFSEPLDSNALQVENYLLFPNLESPEYLGFLDPLHTKLHLVFEEAFIPWDLNTLTIDALSDLNGNSIISQSVDFVFSPTYIAKYGELRFSEILPDPTPSLALPESEFIEIFNNCDSIIQMENYILVNSGEESLIPAFQLYPDSFLILCKSTEVENFAGFGSALAIDDWHSLLNSGDSLVLRNNKNVNLDFLYYQNSWFNDPLKAEGGWSLERIDFASSCLGKENWKESISIYGGSPGKQNSISDMEIENEPYFKQAYLEGNAYLILEFEGELDSTRFLESEVISEPQMQLDWNTFSMSNNSLGLSFAPPIEELEIRKVKIKNMYSCQGSAIEGFDFMLAMTQKAEKGDLVINELLFNAYTGAHDFIEIYNRSDKYVDLKDWRILELWEGIVMEDARLSDSPLIFAPGNYFVFSEEPNELPVLYPYSNARKFIEVTDFPSLSDKEGEVHLLNDDLLIIDSLFFTEEMHFSLIEDKNGVSIERIHPDKPSLDRSTWISASESVKYATPGIKNSHFLSQVLHGGVHLEPIAITPNNDGIDDVMQIHYSFEKPGWLGNVKVFNDNGELVNELVSGFWMEQDGSFIWNGLNDKDERVGLGIYIVFLEVYNEEGEMLLFKKPCIVE